MFKLTNKAALVTGAASGIGEAVAHTLANAEAFVYVADLNQEAGHAVVEQIQQSGGRASFLKLNVTDGIDCQQAHEKVIAEQGKLDVLINNAGIGHVGTIEQTSGEDLDRLYAVNVRGIFNVTKVFIPGMIERKTGAIVNVASIGGIVAVGERLAYCATKFAVVGLTKCLALDHALDGVRVNCVCPGRVETPFVKARLKEYTDPEKAYREMAATQAIGRMGTPEEIAAAILYLARRGCWVEFDGISRESLKTHLDFVMHMAEQNLLNQTLISMDAGWYHVGEPGGGQFRGYDSLFTEFLPVLRRNLKEPEVKRLISTNPQSALTYKVRSTG